MYTCKTIGTSPPQCEEGVANETTNCRQSQGYNCTHVHTYIER